MINWEFCKKNKPKNKTEIWPYEQEVYAQPGIRPREWDVQNSLGFWDTNGSSNLDQMTRHSDGHKKENLPMSELCRPGWPQSKIKRNRKES